MVCLGNQSEVMVGRFAFSFLKLVDSVLSFVLHLCSITKSVSNSRFIAQNALIGRGRKQGWCRQVVGEFAECLACFSERPLAGISAAGVVVVVFF